MARNLSHNDSQYLAVSSAPVTTTPLTMACWVKLSDVPSDVDHMIFMMLSSGTTANYFALYGDKDADEMRARLDSGTQASQWAAASAAVSSGVWQHYCGVFVGASERHAYLNGTNKGSSTGGPCAPTGINEFAIGARYAPADCCYLAGAVGEATIWNAALSDAEVLSLAEGWSSRFIRPGNIKARWDFFENDKDSVGGYHLTDYNGPTYTDSPRLIYPALP